MLQIMDWYCATFSLMLLSLTECVVIAWIYGTHTLSLSFSLSRSLIVPFSVINFYIFVFPAF